MRQLLVTAALTACLLVESSARAEDPPDSGLALVVGGATLVAGLAVGGTLLAASGENPPVNEAGWLVMQGGFALAPLTSHAVVGEWGRGAAFASIPAAAALGTLPVFAADGNAVAYGTLWEQRAIWALYCVGLAGGIVGVLDTAFAPGRVLHVAPSIGRNSAGFVVGGTL
jgi:hypothetical protein